MVPVTGRGDPQVCEKWRLPHFLESGLTDDGEVVSLARRPAAIFPQEGSSDSFLLEVESTPRAIVRLEVLGQLKNLIPSPGI
jgi:hypothetical protein